MFTKIYKKSEYLIKNKEYSGTLYVTLASIIGAVFSYLLQLFLGKSLSIENFGAFTALLSLSYLISVPSSVIGISLIKKVSSLYGKKESSGLSSLYRYLIKLFLCVGLITFLIISFTSPFISNYLKIDSLGIIVVFGTTIIFSLLNTINGAYLQGTLRYLKFSFFTLFNSLLRFIFPVLLVFLGMKLYGVFVGMSLGALVNFFFGYLLLKDILKDKEQIKDIKKEIKEILMFSVPVLFTNLFLMLLSNVDMIMAKRFLNPTSAGYYAGTITLGKILLFGSTPVATVMFPIISSLHSKGENITKKFLTLLGLQAFVVLIGFAIFQAFPGLITTTFFGSKYVSSIKYLPFFSVFVLEYVLINFLVLFSLAIDLKKIFIALIPGVLFQIIYLSINNDSIFEIINANIYAGIISLILIVIFLVLNKEWYKKQKQKNLTSH